MLQICLTNSYNVASNPKWYQVTITDRRGHIPYESPEIVQRRKAMEKDRRKERGEEEEEPWCEPERHQIICAHVKKKKKFLFSFNSQ